MFNILRQLSISPTVDVFGPITYFIMIVTNISPPLNPPRTTCLPNIHMHLNMGSGTNAYAKRVAIKIPSATDPGQERSSRARGIDARCWATWMSIVISLTDFGWRSRRGKTSSTQPYTLDRPVPRHTRLYNDPHRAKDENRWSKTSERK